MSREISRILVTGGAGFIGSAVCRHLITHGYHVLNLDKLTYAGRPESLRDLEHHPCYEFRKVDICDRGMVLASMHDFSAEGVMHLAAESHVDRSIDSPAEFLRTNVIGTFEMLNAALEYWRDLDGSDRARFRFHHVSTDEVFGDLSHDEPAFTERTPYSPSSPYSASKASSDHFVRAWRQTYGLPVVLSNCSNNYGPFHFPEKLIPLVTLNALDEKPLPIYGDGTNVRDWLYVDDHARALELVLTRGKPGESYNIGGRAERTNLQVVKAICDVLDRKRPRANGESYEQLIKWVVDRPGHDRRYAIDPSKAERELGWSAVESFESGLEKTVDWYVENEWWWRPIREHGYDGERLGHAA